MENFKNIPTWVIILTFIFAWPIGMVLMVLKYMNNNQQIYTNVIRNVNIIEKKNIKLDKNKRRRTIFKVLSIIQLVIAIIFFFFFITDIVIGDTENIEGGIIVNIIAFVILLPLCISYLRINSFIKKIEMYQELILIRDIYDTNKLAKYLGCSRSKVLNFVSNSLINLSFINNSLEFLS